MLDGHNNFKSSISRVNPHLAKISSDIKARKQIYLGGTRVDISTPRNMKTGK